MTETQEKDFFKYLETHFRHLDKQNQAILTALAAIMTPEQYRKYSDTLRKQNTRQARDAEKMRELLSNINSKKP